MLVTLFYEWRNPRVSHGVWQRQEGSPGMRGEPRVDGPGKQVCPPVGARPCKKAHLCPFSVLGSGLYTGTCGDTEVKPTAPA